MKGSKNSKANAVDLKKDRKSGSDLKKDRKSGSGMIGSPKKGGHGGKFTWAGGDGYSPAELDRAVMEPLDPKDPNFQDPDDATVAN